MWDTPRRRAIPAELAAMIGIEAGEELEFDHLGDGTLRLRIRIQRSR